MTVAQAGARCRSRPATATAPRARSGPRTRRVRPARPRRGRRRRPDPTGKAMVVGATGAIGSVLRAAAGPRQRRALAGLARDRQAAGPQARHRAGAPAAPVHVAATPDEHLGDMDVIVTATSGAGKRVLDIMAVKPGCVITDVARPLDLSAEDVAKRPDVLVDRVRRDRAARRRADEEHRPAAGRRLRLPGRDRRAGPRGALRDLHGRAATSSGRRSRRSTGSASSTA